ncbi:MAG: DUF3185 domain-containing protein [Planctomycetota bacterium]|nr:DUF3185 domain-containing protein [Planctomycetota bacterium]
MKNALVVGIVLVVLGAAGLVWDKISFTETKKDVDLGPIEISHEKEHEIEIPKVAGMLTVAAGMVLIVYGAKRSIS